MERSGVFPMTHYFYRKGVGNCDVLLCLSHTLQSDLESRYEARIVQINFRTPLIRSSVRKFSMNSDLWVWRFWVVYTDTVSIKSITERYGGRLLE